MKRIDRICDFIYPYKHIADIGCDHGYLILDAINKYDDIYAYAIDNKIGPLNQAKENLKDYDNVKFFLSDGLNSIDDSIDCLIIAGMGGNLICKIINDNINKLNSIKRIIIQANKDENKVRLLLSNLKYKIIDEDIIEEDDIIYEIMVFEKGEVKYNYEEIEFGPILLNKKNDVFYKKWNNIYLTLMKVNYDKLDNDKKIKLESVKKILCK